MIKEKIIKQQQHIIGSTSDIYSSSAKSVARRKVKELESMETEFVITNEEEARSFFEQFSKSKLFRQCFIKLEIPTPNKLGQKIIGINEYDFDDYANGEQRGLDRNQISFYFENGSKLPYSSSYSITDYNDTDLDVKIRSNGSWSKTVDECIEHIKQKLFGTAVTNKTVYVSSEFTINYKKGQLKYLIPLNEERNEPNKDIEKFIKEHVEDMGVYCPSYGKDDIYDYAKTNFTFCDVDNKEVS